MKPCSTCGNELDEGVLRCPFCERPQPLIAPARDRRDKATTERVATLPLKEGMPTVEVALARLESELVRLRGSVAVVRIIHGYGSSGTGGRIRDAVRKRLASMKSARQILSFVPGELYARGTSPGRELLRRHPALRTSLTTDRQNPGITFVEL